MAENPNLRVKISAEFAELKAALANIQAQLKGVGAAGAAGGREAAGGLGQVRSISDEIGSKLKTLVALLVTVKMGQFARDALDTAENIGHLAQKTGATTEQLSAMRVVVHGNAAEFAALEPVLVKLASTQDKAASGNKEAAKAFERLGISIADVKSKNPGDLFLEIAQKIAGMEAGASRTALAIGVLGKKGGELIPIMLDLANGGFEEARKKAEAFGLLLSQDMVEDADAANDALDDLKLVGEGLANSFLSKLLPSVTRTMEGIRDSAEGDGVGAMEILGQAGAGAIQFVASAFSAVGKILAASIASFANNAAVAKDIVVDALTFNGVGVAQKARAALAQQKRLAAELFADLRAEGAKVFDAFAGNTPRNGKTPEGTGGGGTDGDPEGDAKKIVKGIVDQAQLAADAIKHELEVLKQEFDDGLLSIEAYFARKLELQRQVIDAQIEQARAEAAAATSSDQQSRALTKIIQLEREREKLGPEIEREKKKAVDDLNKSLEQLSIRMLELQGRTAEAARLRLEGEFKGLIQKLHAEGREAELATLRGFLDASVVKAQVSEFEARASAILASLRTAETSLGSQAAGGLLGPLEAERQIDGERDKALEKLRQLRAAVQAYYDATKDPSVLQFLQQLTGEIGQVQAAQDQWRQQTQQLATDSVFGFLDRFAKGGIRSLRDLKQAFGEMVLTFIQGMARMAAEALAKRFIFSLLGLGTPAVAGASSGASGFLSAFGGEYHSGGIAGAGGKRRAVNPLWYGAAPRYHGGGIAGLGPREIPAVLERGEEILTTRDSRHRNNGGGGRVTTPVVAIGDEAVANALAGLAGEQVVLTHVRNNIDAILGGR